MIKRITLVRRREGMSKEDFVQHWATTHAELAARLPGIRGCRINVVQEWVGGDQPWDGIGEIWFDSEEAMAVAFEELAAEFDVNRPLFIGEACRTLVDEVIVVTGSEPTKS
ncbi:MAG: EthD family reductase [Thermoleophilia bacterium]|nr:EthD family reductase [Thermoleophilia bacterium]